MFSMLIFHISNINLYKKINLYSFKDKYIYNMNKGYQFNKFFLKSIFCQKIISNKLLMVKVFKTIFKL